MADLRIGFGRRDITPRVGVELAGFGPFLCRRSDGVRDRLWARAVAFEVGGERAVLASCDLLSLHPDVTARVRALVGERTGLPAERVMLQATHTHSGPALRDLSSGWGQADPPYVEILPARIAQACGAALENLREAALFHAEVPCEGIAIKRDVCAAARAPIPLVMSQTNSNLGYATDRAAAAKGGYEAEMVPFIGRRPAFANVGDELIAGLKELDAALYDA